MEWYIIIAIVGVGFISGFINTLAGSGSLLSLPMLMFIGLEPNVANGTNRIAILLQSLVGVGSFKQQKVLDFKQGLWLSLPTIVGSIIGAQLAVNLDKEMMRRAIGGLLIVMFFLIVLKPNAWVKGQAGKIAAKPGILQLVIFFFIGIYGGFIQAGVGFFLLAGLVLGAGLDLVKANAVKILIVLLYTPFAFAVFVINNQIDYKAGLILAAGSMLGAWVAARFAVGWGTNAVRYFLLVILVLASFELIGGFDYLLSMF